MISSSLLRKSLVVILAGLAASQLGADTVEVKNGARILGKITKIDAGSVVVSTDYAGTITIKQSEVTSIATDAPVAVRLSSGTRFDGKVTAGASGSIQIAGSDGTITTTMDKVAASWGAGKVDPALDRHWAYEASVDVAGKTGNKEQLGTAAAVRATLKTPQDTLQYYAAYDRQVADGTKSADQFKAGVDYQNNFSGRYSWYVRDEAGFDRVKLIRFYDVAAGGFGYDMIKTPAQTLTGRAGLSYRYEAYSPNPKEVTRLMGPPQFLSADTARRLATNDTLTSAGLDFGLAHSLQLQNWSLVNRISYVPTFEDFGNYRINHESFFEIPLAAPSWKLRLGVSNDYNSKPGRGVERLDTAYFTRLVLNWQ